MEIEAKYSVREEDLNAWLSALEQPPFRRFIPDGPILTPEMHALYFDDGEQRLSGQQFCLRLRSEGGKTILTVKGAAGGKDELQRRHEWEWLLEDFPLSETQSSDFAIRFEALFKEKAEGIERISTAFAAFDWESLRICAEMRYTRHLRHFCQGHQRIEWCIDHGFFLCGQESEAFSEMEAEILEGDEEGLASFIHELAQLGSLRGESQSKLERALSFCGRCHEAQPTL